MQVAVFCLQFEGVEWVAIAGKLGNNLSIAVRNYGTGRDNAGEAVKNLFGEIGSAGGHRTMAKAVVPIEAFQKKLGTYEGIRINQRMLELVLEFLHETKEK